jgi:hypothetical protein
MTGCAGMFVSPAPQPLVGGVFVVLVLEVLEDARVVEPLPELAALPDCELVAEADEPLAPLEPLAPGDVELPFPEAALLPLWPALPEFPAFPDSEPDPEGVPSLELPHAAAATAHARMPKDAPARLRFQRMRLRTIGGTCAGRPIRSRPGR